MVPTNFVKRLATELTLVCVAVTEEEEQSNMHLWPSSRIRDSFKLTYLSNLEWNLRRMRKDKKQQQANSDDQQKLLSDNQTDPQEATTSKNPSGFHSICRELFILASCCCCFCCGGNSAFFHSFVFFSPFDQKDFDLN